LAKKKYFQDYATKRQVQCYPPPKYFILIRAYIKVNEMSQSETVTHIIKKFFDNMPAHEREQLMARYNQLNSISCEPCDRNFFTQS